MQWTTKILQFKLSHLLMLVNMQLISKSQLLNSMVKEIMLLSFVSWIFQAQWILKLLKGSRINLMVSADWTLLNILSTPSFTPSILRTCWVLSHSVTMLELISTLQKWTSKENRRLLAWSQIWELKVVRTYGLELKMVWTWVNLNSVMIKTLLLLFWAMDNQIPILLEVNFMP